MDLGHPYRHVSPGVVGAILITLAPLCKGSSGRSIARRAGVSSGRAREVLHDLAASGLVHAEEVSPTILYQLNRDHVLYPAIAALAGARQELHDRISAHVEGWEVQPDSVILFGSYARREADEWSDIDLLIIRPEHLEMDDEPWLSQVGSLTRQMRRWTGNAIGLLDLTAPELTVQTELLSQIRRDGQMLVGELLPRRAVA